MIDSVWIQKMKAVKKKETKKESYREPDSTMIRSMTKEDYIISKKRSKDE
jgi:hypothetical protein